eukprot:3018031-Alexandrium_andersonii.AAC.1
MSASLVGSEMCIRDRVGPRPRGAGWTSGGGSSLTPGYSDAAVSGLCPVSYTHLTLPTICSV